jgi:hypothetical protein
MTRTIAEKIAVLQALESPALRARWEQAFKRHAPKRISRDLLLRALAYHVQEQTEGGLSKAAIRRFAGLPEFKDNGSRLPRPAAPRPRPGTRLIREWRGEVHQVSVLDDGFDYREKLYASLSQIAREITGTRWSGPLFFGLRKASRPEESNDER